MKMLIKFYLLLFTIPLIGLQICNAQTIHQVNHSDSVRISVFVPGMALSERLELNYSEQVVNADGAYDNGQIAILANADKQGRYVFRFKIPSSRKNLGLYVNINKVGSSLDTLGQHKNEEEDTLPGYEILAQYFVQSDDDIKIVVHKKSTFRPLSNYVRNVGLHFAGNGSKKYTIRYLIDSIGYWRDFATDYLKKDSSFNANNLDTRIINKALDTLDKLRADINVQAYNELRIHTEFSVKNLQYTVLKSNLHSWFHNGTISPKANFVNGLNDNDLLSWSRFDRNIMIASNDFWSAELRKYRMVTDQRNWIPDSLAKSLEAINDNFIRENMFILSMKAYMGQFRNPIDFFNTASRFVITYKGKEQLSELRKSTEGMPAYNFSLTDTAGRKVRLSDFAGKVIFVDFWYTGCGNCVYYYHDVLSKVEEKFRADSNIVFVSISIDKNKESWVQSLKTGIYSYPKIINLYTNGDGLKDPVIKFYQVLGYPRPLIIDKNQRLYRVDNLLRNKDSLINALTSALKKY